MLKLASNDQFKKAFGDQLAQHFHKTLKANLTNILKRISLMKNKALLPGIVVGMIMDDLKQQWGADDGAAAYKGLILDAIGEALNASLDAAMMGTKSPQMTVLVLETSLAIRFTALAAKQTFKVGQALGKLSEENKRSVAESSDSLYYFIQSQSKADLANVSGHSDQAAKHNRDAAQLVDRTAGNLASTFGFDRAATTAVLRTMAEASKLAATGDMDGARARIQAALDIAKKEDGLVTAPWSISMEDYVRNMESAWVRVL